MFAEKKRQFNSNQHHKNKKRREEIPENCTHSVLCLINSQSLKIRMHQASPKQTAVDCKLKHQKQRHRGSSFIKWTPVSSEEILNRNSQRIHFSFDHCRLQSHHCTKEFTVVLNIMYKEKYQHECAFAYGVSLKMSLESL